MKKIILSLTLAIVAVINATAQVKVEVSETVELMAILSRTAGFEEYNLDVAGQYSKDTEEYFASYRQHPIIAYYQDLRAKYGIGFEYNPSFCKDVRLHGVLSYCHNSVEDINGIENQRTNTLTANIGITWHMNIHRMFLERGM